MAAQNKVSNFCPKIEFYMAQLRPLRITKVVNPNRGFVLLIWNGDFAAESIDIHEPFDVNETEQILISKSHLSLNEKKKSFHRRNDTMYRPLVLQRPSK